MGTVQQVAEAAVVDKRQLRIDARASELRDAAQAEYDALVAAQADETAAHIASLDELDAHAAPATKLAEQARIAVADAQTALETANAAVQALAAERASVTAQHVGFLQQTNAELTRLTPQLDAAYWVKNATVEIDAVIAEGG